MAEQLAPPSGGQSGSVWVVSYRSFLDSLNLIEEKYLLFLVDEELKLFRGK